MLPTSTRTSVPLAVSHRSSSGGGGVASPAFGCDRAQLGDAQVAESEPQRTGAVKRGGVDPKGTLPNTLVEHTCAFAMCLVSTDDRVASPRMCRGPHGSARDIGRQAPACGAGSEGEGER